MKKQWLAGQEEKLWGQPSNSTGPRNPQGRKRSPPSGQKRLKNLSKLKGKLERDVGKKKEREERIWRFSEFKDKETLSKVKGRT